MVNEGVKKLLILIVMLLVVFVAFFFLFWRPGFNDLRKYQTELSVKEAELIQLERDAKDWPDSITREKLKVFEDELEKLWSLIPSEEEVSMLLDEIQSHAKSSDLEIISLSRTASSRNSSSAQEVEQTRYVRVPYKISLGGSYFGLTRFMRKLEDSRRLVTVTDIRLRSLRMKEKSYHMDAEIEFNIFYSKVGVETS